VDTSSDVLASYPRLTACPFPETDIIEVMMIVWRVRGKIIRSVMCSILCNSCAQCSAQTHAHTHMNRPNSCLLVRFSFSVVILCVTVYLLDLAFWVIFCYSLLLCVCVCFCCALFSLFSTVPRDWLGRTFLK